MRRVFVTISCVVVAIGFSTACGGNPTTPSPTTAFVGTWQNVAAQNGAVEQIVITLQGGQLAVHDYGNCVPTYCDWGQVTGSPSASGMLSLTWQFSFEIDTQSLTVSNGQLRASLHTHFIDGSGRPDYDAVDLFNKTS